MMLLMLRTHALGLPSLALWILSVVLTGCASAPEPTASTKRVPIASVPEAVPSARAPSLGEAVAAAAIGMLGLPYRYGGTDPQQGFDCSGLVYYTYGEAGHAVPRTSREQFRAARKIALDEAGAGDIMFFQDEAKLSHVGIYVGDGMFVHAPANGRRVALASIDAPYYQQHLIAVGRLLPH
jgi:cell wall-associated NlpC family hydrolase